MSPESFIIGADKVLKRFGEWPHFHDMEVVSLHMERRGDEGPWIEFVVFAWNYTGRIASSGQYEQATHSLIRLRCEHVTANQFDDFNHQNVLDGLELSQLDDQSGSVEVRLPSIYGLGGSLKCRRVCIQDVVPATTDGLPLDEG